MVPIPGLEDVLSSSANVSYVTVGSLVKRMRKLLEDEPWEDKLTAAYTAPAGTTLTLNNPTAWAEGDLIEVDDATGSQFRVLATPSANPVSVSAGDDDTPDVNHLINSRVLKNPRFGYDICSEAITRCIDSDLMPYVYVTKTATIVPPASPTSYLYAMPADFLGLVDGGITQKDTASVSDLYIYRPGSFQLVRNVPAAMAASTVALRIWTFQNTTNNVNVFYRAAVTTGTIPDDEIGTLIVYKACSRVVGAKEVPLGGVDQNIASVSATLHPGDLIRTSLWFDQKASVLEAKIAQRLRRESPPAKNYVKLRG